jgi:PKD repeat protein
MRNITSALVTAAALVAGAACTVHDTSIPTVAVPSEVSTSLRLTATPSAVPQDGATPARIFIESFDPTGTPVKNLNIQLFLSGQGALSTNNVVTGSDGKASVVFMPPALSGPSLTATVHATTAGTSGDFRVSISLLGSVSGPPTVPNSPPPTVDFVFSPTKPVVNQNVFFDASASKAVSGHAIVGYRWNFGDGAIDTTSGVSTSHQFGSAGTRTVTLTVTDDAGASGTKPTTIDIASGAPTASFSIVTAAPYHPAAPITFNASGSFAVAGSTIVDYLWTMVDPNGTVTTIDQHSSPTVTFSFVATGTASVQLAVTDDSGRKATFQQTLQIQ